MGSGILHKNLYQVLCLFLSALFSLHVTDAHSQATSGNTSAQDTSRKSILKLNDVSGIPWETQYSSRVLVRGVTRRHVVAKGVVHIGKEADRWKERFLLGDDPDAEVVYG